MQHVIYAKFPDAPEAMAAMSQVRQALSQSGRPVEAHIREMPTDIDQPLAQQSLHIEETDAVPALRRGSALGLLVGTGLGLALAPTFDLPLLMTLALGVLFGVSTGAIASLLVGSSRADRALRQVHEAPSAGVVLATFTVADAESEAVALDILARCHAVVERKAAV